MLVTGKGHWIRHLKRSLLRFKWRPKGLEKLSYVHVVAIGGQGEGQESERRAVWLNREGRGKQQSRGRWPLSVHVQLQMTKAWGSLERHSYIYGPPSLPPPLFPINDGTPCWHVLWGQELLETFWRVFCHPYKNPYTCACFLSQQFQSSEFSLRNTLGRHVKGSVW